MMYVGVLVDGLMVEATVAVVHIDIISHGKLATVVTTAASRHDCSSKNLYVALWFWQRSDFG